MFGLIKGYLERAKLQMRILKEQCKYSSCYNQMEDERYAVFGMCGGIYHSPEKTIVYEKCVECPFFVDIEEPKYRKGGEED